MTASVPSNTLKPIRRVLIVNRGEIAVRIAQTLQEMGITVAVLYSEADALAEHVRLADEAYPLPGNTPAETYLQKEQILAIARAAKIDAIHPGYGFLSENADFAAACEQAGIVFIGPRADVIRAMGDKITAKALMEKADVPIVPGYTVDAHDDEATVTLQAKAIGYPILVKAAAGGGGKGMRLVHQASELKSALEAAAREAQSAFGDARVFLEKYIARSRHIEFQILGDHHGNVVHLFERECSIQRRHQKIIEESPSPVLTHVLRAQMGDAAVAAAAAMGYTNAGTVEFIVGEDGCFYFLEVNTRLQVEHPITEMTVRQDLVRLQVDIAAGKPLPFTQADLSQDGHAIECRIYAEDPMHNFMPATGRLEKYVLPAGPGIRVDNGVRAGVSVSVYYDPMLAKLVVWGKTRPEALARLERALGQYVILGVVNNVAFLREIIRHPAFQRGETHTHFLEEHAITLADTGPLPDAALCLAALKDAICKASFTASVADLEADASAQSPWRQAEGWRALTWRK